MMGTRLIALASRRRKCVSNANTRKVLYTTTIALSDLSKFYKVEVSNAARPDATKITVVGPDKDGILASMTVALAQAGCSLKELHAGYAEMSVKRSYEETGAEANQIEDVFFVAKNQTGEQFPDVALQDLGESLLNSLSNPIACLSGRKDEGSMDLNKGKHMALSKDEQITVVKRVT